jgi:hypothetical protein
MIKIVHVAKREALKLLPVTAYFLFSNELLALTQQVIAGEYGITVTSYFKALVMALVIAKVVLVVDLLPFMNIFKHKAAIWNTMWSASIYTVASLVFRLAEGMISGWSATGSFSMAFTHFSDETQWPRFWLVQTWIFLLLVNYCLFQEVGWRLAPRSMFDVVFGDPKID